jgi:hypothetical protein
MVSAGASRGRLLISWTPHTSPLLSLFSLGACFLRHAVHLSRKIYLVNVTQQPVFPRLALSSSFRVKPGLCTYEGLSSFRCLFSQLRTASDFSTIISTLLARSPPILLSFPWLSLSIPQPSVLSPLFGASTLDEISDLCVRQRRHWDCLAGTTSHGATLT